MPAFRYRALQLNGQTVRGEIDAADRAAAIGQLQAQGLVPLAAEAAPSDGLRALLQRDVFGGGRLSRKERADLIQQLATLVGAGIAVEQALAIAARRDGAARAQRAAEELLRRLRQGASLSDALKADAETFPPIAIGMVRAGEMTGHLDAALARLAAYLRRSEAVRQSVYSALVYPAMLVATAFLSVVVILTVVVPQLEPLFVQGHAALPLATRVVIATSAALRGWWWAGLLALALLVLLLYRGFADPAVKRRRDALMLRLPLLGTTLRRAEVARFARTLGTLAGGNVPLPAALGLAQGVLSNAVMTEAVAKVATEVKEGGGLSEPLARVGVFPPFSIQLVRIGEATGRLDDMLIRLADLFEGDVQRMIERSLALLVPVMTIVLGMIVAGIIASLMIAILSVNDLAA